MPSINEVWEQALLINSNLAIVHNDLLALQACCTAVGEKADDMLQRQDQTLAVLNDTRTLIQHGFQAVVEDLQQLQAGQALQTQVLVHQTKQNQTIICALDAISKNTCMLVNLATADAPKQTAIAQATADLAHLTRSAFPDAALELARQREHERALAKCCDRGRRPEPACTHKPCPDPGPFRGEAPDRPDKPTGGNLSSSAKS